jgi:hypothetical protein
MKSVLDKVTRDELATRISKLDKNSTAQWGKMNVGQMLEHCTRAEELYLGKTHMPRVFIGYLFGKMALKNMLKDDAPVKRNMPTKPEFVVTEAYDDVEDGKERWTALLRSYEQYDKPQFVHFFFGPMSKEQLGFFVYKHADHHLRQFGC